MVRTELWEWCAGNRSREGESPEAGTAGTLRALAGDSAIQGTQSMGE